MSTSLINLLIALVVWLLKALSNTTSKERKEATREKVPLPPSTPQVHSQPAVQTTIPLPSTYAGVNKAPSPTKATAHEPAALKPYRPTPPRPGKKLAHILDKYSRLRKAIVISELLQPKNF